MVTLINAAPEITQAVTLVRAFAAMIREHAVDALESLDRGGAPERTARLCRQYRAGWCRRSKQH